MVWGIVIASLRICPAHLLKNCLFHALNLRYLHFEFFDRCVDDFDFAYLSPSFGYSVAKDFLLCECAIIFWI